MPIANLKLDRSVSDSFLIENGVIPETIQTDSGIFLIEIQGTIHVGKTPLITSDLELNLDDGEEESTQVPIGSKERQIGYFDFSNPDKVSLVIGKHQRLVGKIVKVNPPMALIELDKGEEDTISASQKYQPRNDETAELEVPVLEIIRHKIIFNSRPEPVT